MEYLPFLALRKSELSHLIIVSSLARVSVRVQPEEQNQ